MKIEKCIEIKASKNDIKNLIIVYNHAIYEENKKEINEIIERNIVSENPKNISIILEDLQTPMFLYADLNDMGDLKILIEDNIMAIMPRNLIEIMQSSKSSKLIVYEDDQYTEGLFVCHLDDAIY
jgi:hypothetical protein